MRRYYPLGQQVAAEPIAVSIGDERIRAFDAGDEEEGPQAFYDVTPRGFDALGRRTTGPATRQWADAMVFQTIQKAVGHRFSVSTTGILSQNELWRS